MARHEPRHFIVAVVLFIVAWLVTYNAAFMCGDDVTHLHGAYGNQIYLPNFRHDWIPNRVFDLYGRNLVARLFDAVFLPLRALTGIGFFNFYKAFSATMFAMFLWMVFEYMRAQLLPGRGLRDLLLNLGLAAAVLLVLPWTNQVRLLCYELPAFLSFVVLLEISKMFCTGAAPTRVSPASLSLLGFVVAFSLEAYTAILLLVILSGAVCLRVRGGRVAQSNGVAPALVLSVSCSVALLMAAVFSTRPEDVHRGRPMPALHVHGISGFVCDVSLCGVLVVVGILLLAALVLTARHWRLAVIPGMAMGLLGLVLAATLIVVGLISLQADQNYFSFASYPWGGLTLIAQLLAVLVTGLTLAPSAKSVFGAEFIKLFVLFLVVSRIAVAVLGGQAAAAQTSAKVAAAYGQVVGGADGVVQTKLGLDGMEMQERPLPTVNSPGWFIRNYHDFFEKYYGVDFKGTFK